LRTQSEATPILKKGLSALIKTLGDIKPNIEVQAPTVNVQPKITVAAPDTKAFGESLREMKTIFDNILMPLVVASYRKMKMDHSIWEDMKRVNDILKKMDLLIAAESVKEAVAKKRGAVRKEE
jgi:hypothetical protein